MPILIKNTQRAKKLNQSRTKKDLSRALRLLRLQQSELSVVFVGDTAMRKLNLLYRGLDKTTDVLSFPLTDHATDRMPNQVPGQVPDQVNDKGMLLPGNALGDIVVSIPRAVAQAETYGVSFRNELLRLLIHGLLHLIGYDHEKNAYQKKRMQRKERELIDALTSVD